VITVTFGAVSDTGKLRNANEDSFFVGERLFAVADGMGGHNAGEVASAMTVQLLRESANQLAVTPESFAELISTINNAIFTAATGTTEQRGMGTTLTAIAISGSTSTDEHVVIVNVGDSRTYIVREGELRQITVDHSYVQELVTEGIISTDDARTHPRRNIVTRALGIDSRVVADSWTLPIVNGDRYILCSDGLVDEISNEEILAILMENTDPQRAAECLIAAANDRGGRDNVTVIVVDVRLSDKLGSAPNISVSQSGPTPVTRQIKDVGTSSNSTRKLSRMLVPLIVIAIISLALVAGEQISQRGYFVGFSDSTPNGYVVIYKGTPRHFLWYGPSTASTSNISRQRLLAALVREIDDHPRFDALDDAQSYVDALNATLVSNGG